MGANVENAQLMAALEADQSLKVRGFTAACGPTGGVVIDRWNHVRGVWHFHQSHYFWFPAGYIEPSFRCDSQVDAIAYTVTVIAKT